MINNDFAANQTNALVDPNAYYSQAFQGVSLKELQNNQGRITRVRFLREMGRYDISYIHGEMHGKPVFITDVPPIFLRPHHQLKGLLITWAQEVGVYGKGLGLLDDGNWSIAG